MRARAHYQAVIESGGVVKVRDPQLPEGATADITINYEMPKRKPRKQTDLIREAPQGDWTSAQEVVDFIRQERDEWD